MKTIIPVLALVVLLASCEKQEDNVSKVVEVSYPTITLKGEPVENLAVGATYADAGATLTDDISGQTSDLTPASNTVDTSVPGLYLVDFVASNANGYESQTSRVITVTDVADPVDYSGNYLRSATGQTCVITKIANGVYTIQNPGGAAGADDVIIYMVETALGTFIAPSQPSSVGPFAMIGITLTGTGGTWRVDNAGYGPALRTFVKQ